MKTFRQAMQGKAFTVTADLTLQSHSDADDVARQVDLLGPWVDAIQVTDNPWSGVQMSALAAASLVLRQGVDPIAVLTCRDRNRIALYSDLLGLRRFDRDGLGVKDAARRAAHTARKRSGRERR